MASVLQTKARRARVEKSLQFMKGAIARDIAGTITTKNLTQFEASEQTRIAPSQVSLLCTGKIRGFSLENLLKIRALLGATIHIAVVAQSASSSVDILFD